MSCSAGDWNYESATLPTELLRQAPEISNLYPPWMRQTSPIRKGKDGLPSRYRNNPIPSWPCFPLPWGKGVFSPASTPGGTNSRRWVKPAYDYLKMRIFTKIITGISGVKHTSRWPIIFLWPLGVALFFYNICYSGKTCLPYFSLITRAAAS